MHDYIVVIRITLLYTSGYNKVIDAIILNQEQYVLYLKEGLGSAIVENRFKIVIVRGKIAKYKYIIRG